MYFTHHVICLSYDHSDLLQNNALAWCLPLERDRSPNAIDYVLLLTLINVEHVQEIKAAHVHSNEIVSITLYSLTPCIITILQQGLNQSPPLSPLFLMLSIIFSGNWFNLPRSQISFLFVLSQYHLFLCPFPIPDRKWKLSKARAFSWMTRPCHPCVILTLFIDWSALFMNILLTCLLF